MKRFIAILMIILVFSAVYGQRDWKIYTNTTHVYDMVQINDNLLIASWGGLLTYDLIEDQYVNIATTIDGYTSNDICCLDLNRNSGILSVGTFNDGVDRVLDDEFLMPLTDILGLVSNSVQKMAQNDSLLVVATELGLSIFEEVEGFPFPVLIDNFDVDHGLSASNITSLAITNNGYIVCGSGMGIDYISVDSLAYPDAWNHLNADNSQLPASQINSIAALNNMLAIATTSGLATVTIPDFNDWQVYDEDYFGSDQSIYPIYLGSDASIWFGFGYWDKGLLSVVDEGDIAINRIFPDGNLRQWYADELPIPTNEIMNFNELDDGRMVVATWGEGLLIEGENNWISRKSNSISASLIKEIEIDSDGKLWACNGYLPSESYLLLPRGTTGVSSFDGNVWTSYNSKDSPLQSDNIYSLEVDSQNRIWFGAWYVNDSNNPNEWDDGISILNQETGEWSYLTSSDGLRNNAISFIEEYDDERMWVCSFGGSNGGTSIVDINTMEVIQNFDLWQSADDNHDPTFAFEGDELSLFGGFYTGIRIWFDDSIPYENGPYWELPPSNSLIAGHIYAIDSRIHNGKEEIWIASENGLFSYSWSTYFDVNGEYMWNLYGTIIKKKTWRNNDWYDESTPEFWYIEGQERLYGSVPTYPTALFIDPFDRIWIGTDENGITIYDINQDNFINLNKDNSPLISNRITDFAYDKFSGTLYIGTPEGLNSANIGISAEYNTETKLDAVIAYPNPFYPEKGEVIRIESKDYATMPKGDINCYIYDLSGELIVELDKDIFEQFTWDGNNADEKKCSSGLYFFVITTPDGKTAKGKIALIR